MFSGSEADGFKLDDMWNGESIATHLGLAACRHLQLLKSNVRPEANQQLNRWRSAQAATSRMLWSGPQSYCSVAVTQATSLAEIKVILSENTSVALGVRPQLPSELGRLSASATSVWIGGARCILVGIHQGKSVSTVTCRAVQSLMPGSAQVVLSDSSESSDSARDRSTLLPVNLQNRNATSESCTLLGLRGATQAEAILDGGTFAEGDWNGGCIIVGMSGIVRAKLKYASGATPGDVLERREVILDVVIGTGRHLEKQYDHGALQSLRPAVTEPFVA